MTPWAPACPRCGGRDHKPTQVVLAAADAGDDLEATHECRSCGTKFRATAPAPFVQLSLLRSRP